jgi:hypothetical protein
MREIDSIRRVAKHIKFTVNIATVRARDIGERLVPANVLNMGDSAFGERFRFIRRSAGEADVNRPKRKRGGENGANG